MDVQEQGSLHVPPGVGVSFFALTDWATTKVRGEDTGGRFSVVEQTTLAGARPPLHTHGFDELHYILAGDTSIMKMAKSRFMLRLVR